MRTRAQLINSLEMYRQDRLCEPHLAPIDERVMMAWIFHDNLLEDRCLQPEYIQVALKREDHKLPSYLKPLLEDIRIYEDAVHMVMYWAQEGPSGLSVARLEELHRHLLQHEAKEGARVRRNSPVHRNYQQKICAHTSVSEQLHELFLEMSSFDVELEDALAYAARLQHKLMFIYPYRRQPGNLARLLTNQFLLAHRYPPLVIASHERGAYYDAIAAHDAAPLTRLFYQSMWHMLDTLPSVEARSRVTSYTYAGSTSGTQAI